MNILIQNKELKEKINELLNGEEKIQVNEITSEINLRKTYGNRDVINDTTFGLLYDKKIFGFFSDKKLSLKKLIKTREFLNKENLELNIKNYLLSLSKKRIESKYEEDKNEFEVSKIFYVVALFIIVISFYGHYAGWSYSFWNENDFLTFLNVIGTLILVGSIFIFFDLTLNLNYYNKINNLKKSYFMEISTLVALIFLGGIYFYFKETKNIGYTKEYEKGTSYSQPQPQQEVATQSVVGNKDVNRYIPTVEDARSINYKMYYNDYFDYSIDYPDDEYFEITKTYEDGMKLQNDNGEVLISLTSNWNPNGESLQQAYDKAVREKPNATYKFLGKTFFTITYEDNGILVFRKTMYDKNTNKYVYLYVSFPPEYKDYMTPIVERMANSMKKSNPTVTSTTDNNPYTESEVERKFGKVVNDKYVGGSFIEFLRDADQNEYYYLRDQFWEILDTMYVTEDNKTYYYLNDIIDQLETKADWDNSSRVISLEVKGNKMYYTVGFPKGYNANTPSWVQFEIFERKFEDGIGLHTAHVSCAINGVEYKDWDAVYTIFR